eukprot:2746844-Rhodomonas_salina.1
MTALVRPYQAVGPLRVSAASCPACVVSLPRCQRPQTRGRNSPSEAHWGVVALLLAGFSGADG